MTQNQTNGPDNNEVLSIKIEDSEPKWVNSNGI